MMGLINQTDQLDVHGLNTLQRNRTLPTGWIPSGQLRDLRDALAGRLGLEPSMVAPRALLEKLARAEIDGTSPAELPELRRWQLQLLKPLIA